eukprot:4614282-Amphidinium_carterae.1
MESLACTSWVLTSPANHRADDQLHRCLRPNDFSRFAIGFFPLRECLANRSIPEFCGRLAEDYLRAAFLSAPPSEEDEDIPEWALDLIGGS